MISIVIGLGFGDEGKGSTVDFLVRKALESSAGYKPVVVRFNGGHQCGHRVVHHDKEHVFSNFGSGTLRGAETYWGSACTIDPVGFMREYEVLEKKKVRPIIYASPECPVVTPYDKLTNHLVEGIYKHGSTGTGFGTTISRNEGPNKLRLIELRNKNMLKWKMNKTFHTFQKELDEDVQEFYKAVEKMLDIISIIPEIDFFSDYGNKHYIFEGNQGVMLDHEYGFFPHVTRANTLSRGVKKYIDMMPAHFPTEMFFVTRAYGTRHGNGPFPGEEHAKALRLKNTENEKNVRDVWQGDFRTAPLNIDLLKHSISLDSYTRGYVSTPNTLFVTCRDQIKGKVPLIINDRVVWDQERLLHDLYSNVIFTESETWSSDI